MGRPDAREPGDVIDGYLQYHMPRYRFLLGQVERYLPSDADKLLDVGMSPLTELLRERVTCRVDSLGLQPDRSHLGQVHYHADLNEPASLPPELGGYDVIVFAEVVEHLYTSPRPVLSALRRCLGRGGILILQTPNAASLPNRLKLLFGRNPYELIREDRANPGHFREYTLAELRRFAAECGFDVVDAVRRSYFDARFASHTIGASSSQPLIGALKNAIYRLLPPPLQTGITVILRKT